jgi:anti-sigma factor RsiW
VSQISDEMLMAYADGELDGDDRGRVESYLAHAPEGADRLAVFSTTGRGLAGIFEQPMLEPVPKRLVESVTARTGPSSVPASNASAGTGRENVIPFERRVYPRDRLAAARNSRQNWSLAAACVTALAVGAGSYGFLNRSSSGPDAMFGVAQSAAGERVATLALASVLDTTLSGSVAVRDVGGTVAEIKPVFTFATASKQFCRQYMITGAAGHAQAGVACREAGRDGAASWRIETHVAAAVKSKTDGQIVPAGKDGVASVEATVDRLISGNVLGGDEEAALMKGGWSK